MRAGRGPRGGRPTACAWRAQVSLFFSESPTNPYLRCVDVRRISELCTAAGALTCIDSTFATPVNQRALALGADLVLHSATKYLAGHNDVLAGAAAPQSRCAQSFAAYLLGERSAPLHGEACERCARVRGGVARAAPGVETLVGGNRCVAGH